MTEHRGKGRKINFAKGDRLIVDSESSSLVSKDGLDNFLEFLESIPDYGQIHHLSNEQFKQKLDYLKRTQRLFLESLQNSYGDIAGKNVPKLSSQKVERICNVKKKDDIYDLKLNGKKCYLEESRIESPTLFSHTSFAGLAEDQDLLTYRRKDNDKEIKTLRNKEIHSANKSWSTWSELKSDDSASSDTDDSIETKSLPPNTSKVWHPTVPKPFSFTLREQAEKYMTNVETEAEERTNVGCNRGRSPSRKRRVRPIPLTSKIPLYDKLLAEKEERSRIVREESALNLLSQVRPFKLECDRRAWRSLARSSPEICTKSASSGGRFKAKPVPKNLFCTEIYDRMLEDEYYRQLKKRIRAAELMKSSSLPPSMARRERVKSACGHLENTQKGLDDIVADGKESSRFSSITAMPSERSRSVMTSLPAQGNNLAAILRCQASREKLEREIKERMEEKRREQIIKMRENLIGRRPVWRALRSAARHEHERDLDIRTSLRRDEAREQAERHRLQMEMMIDRVTQIPTLFERHSRIFQPPMKMSQGVCQKSLSRKKKRKLKGNYPNSMDSYASCETLNNSRPNSGSMTSSSGTFLSLSRSSKSSKTSNASGLQGSEKSADKSENSATKKRAERGQLKVSINEKAELIEDQSEEVDRLYSDDGSASEEERDVGKGLRNEEQDTSEE
ncbi:hypothetical protein KM043_001929 [Ampulex compressa]|nr:hypothetical protein KM043_001929 [Ampulex compressa]